MRISWDTSPRFYSQGVSKGVLYPKNSPGVPWNGLISVTEKGDDAPSSLFIDGQRYRNRSVPGAFAGTIQAFTYPDEFEPYNGLTGGLTGQLRPPFGLTWRSNREIHVVYNALAAPSASQYKTIGSETDPTNFSWDLTTLPQEIPGGRPSSHIVILVDETNAGVVPELEALLYGDDENDPSLPSPQAIYDIFDAHATLRIIDNHDGTWTAIGPDDVVSMIDSQTFQIDWPSAIFVNATTYRVKSF